MTVKELRLKTGMNRTEFSDYLKIPYQTVKIGKMEFRNANQ